MSLTMQLYGMAQACRNLPQNVTYWLGEHPEAAGLVDLKQTIFRNYSAMILMRTTEDEVYEGLRNGLRKLGLETISTWESHKFCDLSDGWHVSDFQSDIECLPLYSERDKLIAYFCAALCVVAQSALRVRGLDSAAKYQQESV